MSSADNASADPTVTFKGTAKDSDGNVLTDIEVRLDWTAGDNMTVTKTVESDDGNFSVEFAGTYDDSLDNTLDIEYASLLQIMKCEKVDLSEYTPIGSTFELNDNDTRAIFEYTIGKNMKVVGTVKYGSELIGGATVTLFDASDKIEGTQTTEADGKYQIVCEPGTYTLMVKRGGFEDVIITDVSVGTDSSLVTKDIDLVLLPEQMYLGMDLPHLFAIIGLTLAAIMLALVIVYVIYMRRHHGALKIVDDEK